MNELLENLKDTIMEQVFYRQHVRLMRLLSPFKTIRRVVEKYILINSFLCAFILCWLHTTYVNSPASIHSNCLYQALGKKNFTYDLADYDVIRLHISNEEFNHFQQEEHVRGSNPISCEASSAGSNDKSSNSVCPMDDDSCVAGLSNHSNPHLHGSTEIVNSTTVDNQELPLLFDKFISNVGLHIDETKKAPRQDPKESRGRGGGSARLYNVAERLGWTHTMNNADEEDDRKHVFEGGQGVGELKDLFVSQRVYLFSLEKGYLMLRADQRDRHAIRRLDITISSDR